MRRAQNGGTGSTDAKTGGLSILAEFADKKSMMRFQQTSLQSSQCSRKARRRSECGFSLTEVVLGLMIMTLMVVLFGAIFPMATRGAQYGSNYAQAAQIAQHKMDQLRSAQYTRVVSGASLQGLAIIDAPQPSGYPLAVTGGTAYSFTTTDALVSGGGTQGYFAPGSTGVITVCDYATLHPSSGIATGKMAYVTVTLSWTGGGVSNGSYSTSAIIANT